MQGKQQSMKKFMVGEIPAFKGRENSYTNSNTHNSYSNSHNSNIGRKSSTSNEFSYEEEDEYDDDDEYDDNGNVGNVGNVGEAFNDETSLASTISSASSASSQLSKDLNLQVEIGLENAVKNKEILHELSLTMKNMPTISLDSESMNRGSFLKSVTFAEEDDVLEFDYKHDMIFPDYETPVKDRSSSLGSSSLGSTLEDDEDNDKMKLIIDINTNTTTNYVDSISNSINDDGISGQHTNSKILDYNDSNSDIEIENKSDNVQDSNDRIQAAMKELKLQLIHELCPVNEWISHKSDLLTAISSNVVTNDNNVKIEPAKTEKKKKKKASFVAFDVINSNIDETHNSIGVDDNKDNNVKIHNTSSVVIINENNRNLKKALSFGDDDKKKALSFGDDDKKKALSFGDDDKKKALSFGDDDKKKALSFGDDDKKKALSFGDVDNITIAVANDEKEVEPPKAEKVKKKKGISFRVETEATDVTSVNFVSPISAATNLNNMSSSPTSTEHSSPLSYKASPPKHMTVVGSLRTENLAIPRDIIESHVEPPSVCLGGSMSDLQSSEIQKLQKQAINGSTYFPLDPKTLKIRLTISSDTSLDISRILPRTVQYRRGDGVKAISIYHHDPADQDFYNRTLLMKTRSKNLAFELMSSFLKKQSIGFLCILVDRNLQVIGSYDEAIGSSKDDVTGLEFGPNYYRIPTQKQQRKCLLKANLLEIDLKDLSDDVFAIVPIAYDECMKGLSDASIDNIKSKSTMLFEFYCTKEDRYASETAFSLSDEVASRCDGFNGIGGFKSSNNNLVLEEVTSLACQRSITETKKKYNSFQNSSSGNNGSDADLVFGVGQGIIPGIVFRAGVEGEWAMKSLKKVVSTDEIDMLYSQVLDVMVEQCIVPFHLAHVEHCYNCTEHQMSTRHEPGSYEGKFNQLRDEISLVYPPIIFVANHKDISPKPRLGAFEFSFQSYGEDTTHLVFSKLKKGDFPSMDSISAELDTILNLDNSLRFGRGHVPKFKIALVDAYNKKPVKSATLKLYRLCNKVTGNDCFNRNSNAKKGSPSKKQVVLNDADIRHTEAYAHVRSWGKEDIMKWFLSAGASEEAGKNAIFAGVVDGTSLLKLVDASSLQKWGVINRRHLKKLEDFLVSIKGDKKSDGFGDNNEMQLVSQEKQCALVLQQSSDDNGICSFNIEISGSYYIKVDAPNYETYFTHSLLVDSVQKFLYSALMQPKLIQFKVLIDIDLTDTKWLSIINAGRGLIQSLYNIETGKRHFVRIKIPTNLIEQKMANEMAQIYSNNDINNDTTNATSVDDSNGNDNSTSTSTVTKKIVYTKVSGSVFLPIGIYFNEVNGTILNLYKNDSDIDKRNGNGNNNDDDDDDDDRYIVSSSNKNKTKTIHFESRQSTRCHNRLLVKAVRKFQRIYRRYYLKQREWLYATIMRCQLKLMRSLRRARERIANRKAVIIQSCFRRYRQELKYGIFLNGLMLVQSIHRGNLGRMRVSRMLQSASVVSKWIIAWILYLRRKAVIRVKEEQRRIEEEIRRAEEEKQEQERIRILKIEKENKERERRAREEQERLEKALEEKVLLEKERQDKDDQKAKAPILSKSMFKSSGTSGKKENVLAGAAKTPIPSTNDAVGSDLYCSLSPLNENKVGSPKADSPTLSINTSPAPKISSPKTSSPTIPVAGSSNDSLSSSKSKSKKIGHIRNKFKKASSKVDSVVDASTIHSANTNASANKDVSANGDVVENVNDTTVAEFVEPNYLKDDFVVTTTPVKEVNDHIIHEESNPNAKEVTAEDASTQMTPLPKKDLVTSDVSTPLNDYQSSGYIYDDSGGNNLKIDTSTLGGEEEYLSRVLPDRLRRIASMSPMKIIKDSTKLAQHHIKTQTSVLVNTIKSSSTIKKLISKTSELRERVPRGIQELRKYLNKKNIIRDKSATLIQAMIRGAQCRHNLFQDEKFEYFIDTFYPMEEPEVVVVAVSSKNESKDNNATLLPIDRPRFRPNISIVIDTDNNAHSQKQLNDKLVIFSTVPKTPIAKIQDAVSTGIRIASEKTTPLAQNLEIISKMIAKDLNIAKEITSIKGQALVSAISSKIAAGSNAAINATQDYLNNKQNALERKIRRESFQFSSADALLNVHGSFMEAIPSINAHFYIAIYPQTSDDISNFGMDDVIEKVDEETGVKVKVYPFRAKRDRTVERHSNKEGTQSTYLYPFSPEQFMMTSFNCHLTDVSRYTTAEICVFIEAEYFGTMKPDNPYVHQGSSMIEGVPPASDEEKTSGPGLKRYVPAFYGDINIGRGGIFGPQGGRLHVSLKADSEMIKQLAKHPKLPALKSLDMIVTLMPVCIPSSSFLHTFRSIDRVAPCYPSFLVDAELLEHKDVQIDTDNNGAIISIGAFANRIFVSARNRGMPYGIIEYNHDGKIVKKLCDADQLGIINQIICGHNHIACCGSNGNILFLYEGKVSSAIKSSLIESHPGRLLVSFGCVTVHGGVDIFFTGDKSGNICVSFMDNGKCLRQYLNSNFIRSKISSMTVYGSRLYISQSDGTLTVVNIQPIFQGFYESAGQLQNMVALEESVFSKDSGIICSAIASPNGFLGIKDEDEVTKDTEGKFSKVKKNAIDSPYCADVVEGHILLLGGGDSSPHIAILQPFTPQSVSRTSTMREIATLLNAHEKAVTQIIVDAAGRHIFSASAGAKQIKIWDGLSFTVERQIDDINVGCLALAPNCFLVGSVRAPFFRIWKCKNNKSASSSVTALMARSPSNSNRDSNSDNVSDIGIVTYRNPRWLTYVLLGRTPPPKSLIKAITIDDDTLNVISRWSLQYIRPDDDNYSFSVKRAPPLSSGKATPRRIKNSETPRARARRQYEKKLLSPEKKDNTPNPRRLKRLNEMIVESPIIETTNEIIEMATIEPIDIDDNAIKALHSHPKKRKALHFSDSEDDE